MVLPECPVTSAWRGILDEAVAPAELARFFDDTFTFSEARSGGHILVYYIPGASANSTRGKRRLNWVWYVGADDAVGGTENFPSWRLSEGQSQTVVPPRDGLAPQFGPHSEPVHIAPRPSSPALCRSDAKGYLLPDFYSGATEIPCRFSEGLLLRRLQSSIIKTLHL